MASVHSLQDLVSLYEMESERVLSLSWVGWFFQATPQGSRVPWGRGLRKWKQIGERRYSIRRTRFSKTRLSFVFLLRSWGFVFARSGSAGLKPG